MALTDNARERITAELDNLQAVHNREIATRDNLLRERSAALAAESAEVARLAARVRELEAQPPAKPEPEPKPDLKPEPPKPTVGVIYGVNAGGGSGKSLAQRVQQFGRVPMTRRYYKPGVKLPARFDPSYHTGVSPEGRTQDSWKPNWTDLNAGRLDADIVGYRTSATEQGIDLLEMVPWHEPNAELSGGQFSVADFRNGTLRVARLIRENCEPGRVKVTPNFTAPRGNANAWSDSWMFSLDELGGPTWAVGTWDNYGNPAGGGAYDSPYPKPEQIVADMFRMNDKFGWWPSWGVTEFNTPRRTHDPDESKRVAYLDAYVGLCVNAKTAPVHMLLWEAPTGVKWDQEFKTERTVDWWRTVTARTP